MVNVALIGTGFIGEVHAKSISELPNAALTAVISTNEEKGKAFAEKYKTFYYPSLERAVSDGQVDCVDICTPTFLHREAAVQAAEAGKHILCEKPLALSLKDADKIIDAVKKYNVQAMVGHTMRFWPEYVKSKEIIESGELGRPLYGFCQRLAATPDWHKNSWGFNESLSGGASLDLHIHDLDFLLWVFGRPKTVSANGVYNKGLGGYAHIGTNIEFRNGSAAFAEGGWAFSSTFPFTMILRILCEKGSIEWIFRAGKNIEERGSKPKLTVHKADGTMYEASVSDSDAYLEECKYFVDCIDTGKRIENATLEDGKAALELALAAARSAKEGKSIKI